MCVVSKISEIQTTLMGEKFPKSGLNKFNKNRYHELKDILPPIIRECNKHNLVLLFNFQKDYAYLDVTNKDNVEDYYRFSMPMPDLVPLNSKMNLIQSIGADTTYLKRYLLMQAFLILEDDVADALDPETESETEVKNTESKKESNPIIKEKTDEPVPEKINQALIDLDQKGVRITKASVFSRVKSMLTDEDDRQMYVDWIDKNIKVAR